MKKPSKSENEATPTTDQAFNSALRMLSRRDHSVLELKQKLDRRHKGTPVNLDEVIARLKALGYLVDEGQLAQNCVLQWQRRGKGRHWIRHKLKEKGLPPVLFDDESEKVIFEATLEKRLKGRKVEELDRKEKLRLANSLVSRGFSRALVATLLR